MKSQLENSGFRIGDDLAFSAIRHSYSFSCLHKNRYLIAFSWLITLYFLLAVELLRFFSFFPSHLSSLTYEFDRVPGVERMRFNGSKRA